jgi:Xaa-Pro aminopeptidase
MAASLPSQPADVFARRRALLTQHLAGRTAVVFAGGMRARNYPANVFPYRGDSHFLYLVGTGLPEAALVVNAGGSRLYLTPEAEDDALWHGTLPTWDEIAAATGVDEIRPSGELAAALAAAPTATLPSIDPLTRHRQRTLLGRDWDPARPARVGDLGADDLVLADAMIALRSRHDEAAVASIERAVEGTTAAHIAGMRATRPGLYERDIRAAMEGELLARDMPCAYGSIITVHGEILHNGTYHHRLEPNDMVLADLGGEYEGWASDVTRTWPVSGTFSPTQRALYDIVLQSQLDAIAMVTPGTRYRDIHLAAALTLTCGLVDEGILRGDPGGLVERGAHALFFPHGVGHLLGLDVHDMEDLGDRAGYAPDRTRSDQFGLGYLRLDRDLEPGMAVTIEPGLYMVDAILNNETLAGPFDADGTLDRDAVARFADVRGIRIEDDVLCTPTGPRVLTAAIPKTADEVQALVRG